MTDSLLAAFVNSGRWVVGNQIKVHATVDAEL